MRVKATVLHDNGVLMVYHSPRFWFPSQSVRSRLKQIVDNLKALIETAYKEADHHGFIQIGDTQINIAKTAAIDIKFVF